MSRLNHCSVFLVLCAVTPDSIAIQLTRNSLEQRRTSSQPHLSRVLCLHKRHDPSFSKTQLPQITVASGHGIHILDDLAVSCSIRINKHTTQQHKPAPTFQSADLTQTS
jgi:hypothetical protein